MAVQIICLVINIGCAIYNVRHYYNLKKMLEDVEKEKKYV